MYAEERQQEILRRARAAGRVDVVKLAEEFAVTTETIRRDLTVLERAGVLRRVHGGAIPVERLGFEPALATRDEVMTDEKERIAKPRWPSCPKTVDHHRRGLDDASSPPGAARDRELTVIVNAPPLATMLATRANLNVIMLGGRVRGRTLATVDDWALRPLEDLNVDVAFMGTNGCSVDKGLTTPDPAESAIKRAMIGAAERTVVLADHTKFSGVYLARFAALTEIDMIITDDGLDPAIAADITAAGPEVVRA